MNKHITIALVALVAVTLSVTSITQTSMAKPDNAADPNIMVRLVGTDVGDVRTVPIVDGTGTDTGLCFDLDMEDVKTGKIIGTATDCLSDITPVGDGLALVGTTTFNFNDGNQLTARGLTTVQPTTHGSPDVTHITGAIPTADENSILSGTGKFLDATGQVRLSGAVNLSNVGNDEITFDCMFVIDLEK